MRHPLGQRSGFSLVELLIAMLILAALLGAVGLTMIQGSGAYQQGVAANVVESQARRGVDRIASEFIAAKAASYTEVWSIFETSNDVTFDKVIGAGPAGSVVTKMEMKFQLDPGEIDDGVDNDGDGVVDEGRVVLIENPGTVNEVNRVLCTNVREMLEGEIDGNAADDNGNNVKDERGFCLELQGNTLNIRLSLERLDPDGNSLVRTIETTVLLRN